jgi:glucose-1-phosphate adenylyltransferase
MAIEPKVLVIVLAGGEGKRLQPLTNDRAKPAVPFAGTYRLIDFALSNFANAGYLKIVVLTQYKSHSLDRHISQTWRFSAMLDNYVTPVPAQMRRGPYWFQGSADAIYQNLNLISDESPDIVAVFGADHIYRMDPRQMVDEHVESGAGVTVAAIPVPKHEAIDFGVIEVDDDGKILAFHEKVAGPAHHAGQRSDVPRQHGQLRLRHPDADRRRHAAREPVHRPGQPRDPCADRRGRRTGVRLLEEHDPRPGRPREGLLA